METNVTFNIKGGDLGRARVKHTTALELQLLIPHVSHILSEIQKLVQTTEDYAFKYAFEFSAHEKDLVLLVMKSAKLPSNVKFYSVDGNSLFEIRGASGGIASSLVCYLITMQNS